MEQLGVKANGRVHTTRLKQRLLTQFLGPADYAGIIMSIIGA